MKICILTTAFPRWKGDDRGIFIFNEAIALSNLGLRIKVIAIHSPGAKPHEVNSGIEIIRPRYLPEKMEVLQNEGGGLPVVWKKHPFYRLALIPFLIVQTLALIWHSRDCDLILANWTLSGMIAWISSIIHRRPYIVTVHGSDIFQGVQIPWIRFITKVALQKAKKVRAVSRALGDTVISLEIPEDKITVIPDGIDIEKFFPTSDHRDRIVLFVGSIIPRKGLSFLIKAVPRILQNFPDTKFIIIGEGPLEIENRTLADSLGITESVQFLGKQPSDVVANWMRLAEVFVLPSLEEGLGVVLLEALASGTPCIASHVGGIPDIVVNDVNGYLIPPGDSSAIADHVIRLFSDPDIWNLFSRNGRQRIKDEFSWDVVSGKLYLLIEEIIRLNH